MNTIKKKRRRILVKDKTIETLAELHEVSYQTAFDAYIWADKLTNEMDLNPNEEMKRNNNRMLHAQRKLELIKARKQRNVNNFRKFS